MIFNDRELHSKDKAVQGFDFPVDCQRFILCLRISHFVFRYSPRNANDRLTILFWNCTNACMLDVILFYCTPVLSWLVNEKHLFGTFWQDHLVGALDFTIYCLLIIARGSVVVHCSCSLVPQESAFGSERDASVITAKGSVTLLSDCAANSAYSYCICPNILQIIVHLIRMH